MKANAIYHIRQNRDNLMKHFVECYGTDMLRMQFFSLRYPEFEVDKVSINLITLDVTVTYEVYSKSKTLLIGNFRDYLEVKI